MEVQQPRSLRRSIHPDHQEDQRWAAGARGLEAIFGSCVTSQQHNPGKTIKVGHGQEPNSPGFFLHLQVDFIVSNLHGV